MGIFELFLLAVGLSMDAFAVSVCKGLSAGNPKPKYALITGLYFGGFQLLMPLAGFFLGRQFEEMIANIDHWIAFALLALIGARMIFESFDTAQDLNDSFRFKDMLPLAVATSIDALAVGVTFAFLQVKIAPAVCIIGIVTFMLSAVGVKIGNALGRKSKSRAELVGGIMLIAMGAKILLEHLGIWG